MPRIILVDTAYPDFIRSLPFDPGSTYEGELQKVLNRKFGTSDFYSRNLRPLGWDAVDVIANHHDLQNMWAEENYGGQGRRGEFITDLQVEKLQPDVIFLQDVSCVSLAQLKTWKGKYLLAAQISCQLPPIQSVRLLDCVMTSFPHYLKKCEEVGVRSVYLPLAFEPSVLEGDQPDRGIDISFVGGVGRDSHWKQGTDTLEAIASAFKDRFHWYGYGLDRLPESSALRACYRGVAWGKDMYDIYRRSKLVINRHGEVAEGFANNLRMMESAGCGAMLVTENAPNLADLFPPGSAVPYASPSDACDKIEHYLAHDNERQSIAGAGQDHVLANHTYSVRMKLVSEVLSECVRSVSTSRR